MIPLLLLLLTQHYGTGNGFSAGPPLVAGENIEYECVVKYISTDTGLVVASNWMDCETAHQLSRIDTQELHRTSWVEMRRKDYLHPPMYLHCDKRLEGVVIQKGDEFYVCTAKKRRTKK